VYGPADSRGRRASFTSCSPIQSGAYKPFTAAAGQVTKLPIGSPVIAKIDVSGAGRNLVFNLKLTDSAGAPIRSISLAGGETPDAPQVQILGPGGKEVAKVSLEYG
jgi:hypothetical protein